MSAELMPTDEQDERIFAAWKSGKGQRVIAREMGLSQMEVEQAIDRALPALSQLTQSRAYKRQLFLMEDLNTEFYAIAKCDKSDLRDRYDAAHLCARLNERICAMNGWTSVNIRMDPVAAQAAEKPSSHERIKDAIMTLAKGPRWRELVDERLHDLPVKGDGNGALAPPTDQEPR